MPTTGHARGLRTEDHGIGQHLLLGASDTCRDGWRQRTGGQRDDAFCKAAYMGLDGYLESIAGDVPNGRFAVLFGLCCLRGCPLRLYTCRVLRSQSVSYPASG